MKHKKVILIALLAVVFLVVLFFIKNRSTEENLANTSLGVSYSGDETLEELVIKDADLDGVSDWEESLWGTNPNKKDTDDDGVMDSIEISKLKEQSEGDAETKIGETENLTETDKLARELFSNVAALSQAGGMNQATADALASSLITELEKPTARKTYSITQIKTTPNINLSILQKYNNEMRTLYKNYPTNESVVIILTESLSGLEDIDVSVLVKLDPIIRQINFIIDGMLKINVPGELSSLHLSLLNALERWKEDLNDIQLVEEDALRAVKAISQYETTVTSLEEIVRKLGSVIQIKFNDLSS